MRIVSGLKHNEYALAIIGLGNVGLPLAVEFSRIFSVIAYDINIEKITKYKNGIDEFNFLRGKDLVSANISFTNDESDLRKAKVFIIAIPTPVNEDKTPDLSPLASASSIVGKHITKDSLVIFESTVYPGVTEDVCIPILEKASGLRCGEDFKVGYSPERINPGSNKTVARIAKIVSGIDEETTNELFALYSLIITKPLHKAENIKVAEAAKILENIQRDVNIALINEVSIIFKKLGIDVRQVLRSAETKWNFISFNPGLVGGPCIGVDPYYLIYRSKQIGYSPQLISISRQLNESMIEYVLATIIKLMRDNNIKIYEAKVLVLGFSYKEDVADICNTKQADLIKRMSCFVSNIDIIDPIADKLAAKIEYGLTIYNSMDGLKNRYDAIIFAVAHNIFNYITVKTLKEYSTQKTILIDLKNKFSKTEAESNGMIYWSL